MSQLKTAAYDSHSAAAHAQKGHDPHPNHKHPLTVEERLSRIEGLIPADILEQGPQAEMKDASNDPAGELKPQEPAAEN